MELRKAKRVVFERGFAANMMAIDGTWRRSCVMEDASDGGAKLTVEGPLEGLQLSVSAAFLNWACLSPLRISMGHGDQFGVTFLRRTDVKRNAETKPKSETPA